MNTARSGRDRENKLKHYLERALGWHCMRSAASKGIFDIVAVDTSVRPMQVHLIQVKGQDWPSGKELIGLIGLAKLECKDTTVSVILFQRGSSVVQWVDVNQISIYKENKVVIPWRNHCREIDLRKYMEGDPE